MVPTGSLTPVVPLPVKLFTVTSALIPFGLKKTIPLPFPVILFIPEILFGRITVITLFIKPPQNYHQHSKHR